MQDNLAIPRWPGGQRRKFGGSVAFVCLAEIHQRQHHEDEGLQKNDQDVEDRPDGAGQDVADSQADAGTVEAGPGAAQEGDQHENQFAGEHDAEQPHAQRHGLGGVFDQVQQQ
ncbi:hypothetical protein G6F57_018876 [Rhizopus arrhizus]|nr:hypothetical protein G6F57_018876 [Rhizopus arrhizus]